MYLVLTESLVFIWFYSHLQLNLDVLELKQYFLKRVSHVPRFPRLNRLDYGKLQQICFSMYEYQKTTDGRERGWGEGKLS